MAELSTLARPYAKAAFEYAVAANDLQGWQDALVTAVKVSKQTNVAKFLASPSYTSEQKAEKMNFLCGDALSNKFQNFVKVLSENDRLELLSDIYQQFETLKANQEKTVDVDLVCAKAISVEQQQKLANALSTKLKRAVNVQMTLDESLIGGVIVRAGDTVIDGSIRGRLAKLAEVINS